MDQDAKRKEVYARVAWWITDMAFKPPEVLTPWYYHCMADDIAAWAVDSDESLVMERLDPPRAEAK